MSKLYAIPPVETLTTIAKSMPKYMRPSLVPWAVVFEGALSDDICDSIIEIMMVEEPYVFQNCSATTRECPRPLDQVLESLVQVTLEINNDWFGFALDNDPAAWFQTYMTGDSYQLHTDGRPGQTRKLSTVALLSDPVNYQGGTLRLVPYPESYEIPKTRGTLCIFPSWILHEVYPIKSGLRQTINLGFWGPEFK